MKFKFIGKPGLLIDNLTTNNIYNILQFELKGNHMCVYLIDNQNELQILTYLSTTKFNEDWSFMNGN